MLGGKQGRWVHVILEREHWLARAMNARQMAEWVSDPEAKRLLVEIAERYEKVAEMAARMLRSGAIIKKGPRDAQGS
jgi:hypothetical protein